MKSRRQNPASVKESPPTEKAVHRDGETPGALASMQRVTRAPSSLSPQDVLHLQRSIGNQAVQRLLIQRSNPPLQTTPSSAGPILQRKTGRFPKANTLDGDSWYSVISDREVLSLKDYYEVQSEVKAYESISWDKYGEQLVQLDEIKEKIEIWKTNHPNVTKLYKWYAKKIETLERRVEEEEPAVRIEAYEVALMEHQDDREALQTALKEGALSNERRLKNTCEWLLSGKLKVYALTPTGDATLRLAKAKLNPRSDEAFFPKGEGGSGDILTSPVDYPKDNLIDDTKVNLYKGGKRTGGWKVPNSPIICFPNASKKSKATIWQTSKHEVQHQADQNQGRDSQSGVRTALESYYKATETDEKNEAVATGVAEAELQSYKTEYRAYFYQGGSSYDNLDNTTQNKVFKNYGTYKFTEKQLDIFEHIYEGYSHTKDGWNKNSILSDGTTTFREAVVKYWNPSTEGFNEYNSMRVDTFYNALDSLGDKEEQTEQEKSSNRNYAPVAKKESDPNSLQVKQFLNTINHLDPDDIQYINDTKTMQNKIKKHLTGEALEVVSQHLLAHESQNIKQLLSILTDPDRKEKKVEKEDEKAGKVDSEGVKELLKLINKFTKREAEFILSRSTITNVMEKHLTKIDFTTVEDAVFDKA